MTIMKKYIVLISVIFALALTSCSDWLDVKPKTEVPTEDLFSYETGFEDAISGCYIKMNSNNLYGKFLTLSGIDFIAGYYDQLTDGTMEHGLSTFNWDNSYVKGQIKTTYNEFYNVLLQVNDVIEHIDSDSGRSAVKSEEKRNLIKGEALALRAFLHFDILRLYGQVPQNAQIQVSLPYSEMTGIEDRPLYDFNAYVQKLIKDLEDAETLLAGDPCRTYNLNNHVYEGVTDDFYHYRKFRFNYFAVKALQARLYLYLGDRANAYAAAMSVINATNADGSKYFNLAGDGDFAQSNFAMPSETIMGLSNSALEYNEYEILFKNESTSFPMLFTSDRRNFMFAYQTGSNNRYNRWWGEITNATGGLNPYYKKYMQNEGSSSDANKLNNRWMVPLIRLSEVYLIAMESTDNLTEANTLYTDYMLARNVQVRDYFSSLDMVQSETVFEMRIEFMAEGQMFYTYKRTGATDRFFDHAAVTESNYIIPVPDSERK